VIDPQLIADVRFFELLDHEDRQELAKLLDELHLEAGARLFETGDQGEQLYLVHTGKVEISIRNVTGEKTILTIADHGDDQEYTARLGRPR
jgi:CRP-like cAMP-binding protein